MTRRCHPLLALSFPFLLNACGGSSPPGEGGDDWVPPLVAVAGRGNLAALEELLRKDPKPDVRDSCDWTPLMKAALNGHLEAVERLLAAGPAVDAEDKGGYTALMLAASNDHAPVVEHLLTQGAMVDHQERTQGWTALIWAAKQGHGQTWRPWFATRRIRPSRTSAAALPPTGPGRLGRPA